jgi:stage II sporulation protein AB (anti-sigma F factor)
MNNNMCITFEAIPQNEAFARVAISGFLLYLDPTISELSDIKTAVSEAVTNCIIHAYNNKNGSISLSCCIKDRYVHIEIEDTGIGIDNVELARKPLYTSKPEEERCGMGFTVMEAFMDQLTVNSKPNIGTTIIMEKQLGRVQ